jgi:hypothetical protein
LSDGSMMSMRIFNAFTSISAMLYNIPYMQAIVNFIYRHFLSQGLSALKGADKKLFRLLPPACRSLSGPRAPLRLAAIS